MPPSSKNDNSSKFLYTDLKLQESLSPSTKNVINVVINNSTYGLVVSTVSSHTAIMTSDCPERMCNIGEKGYPLVEMNGDPQSPTGNKTSIRKTE